MCQRLYCCSLVGRRIDYSMEQQFKSCVICDKPLSAVNRTGYCRKHYGAANNSARTSEMNRANWASPWHRARWTRALRQANLDKVAWCPLEYRAEYHRLKRVKHLSAAEARVMIEDLMAADAVRFAATGQLQQSRRAA
jgi:hypothetical protein